MDVPAPINDSGEGVPDAEKQLAEIRQREAGEAKTDARVTPEAINRAFERESWQIVVLRYVVFVGMYSLLCAEIHAVLCVLDKQGRGIYHLSDWLIGLMITVVFFQTVWILQVIAKDLFPKGEGNKNMGATLPSALGDK